MKIDDFIEFVTDKTGFCVKSATVDPVNKSVSIEFDLEVDGEFVIEEDN